MLTRFFESLLLSLFRFLADCFSPAPGGGGRRGLLDRLPGRARAASVPTASSAVSDDLVTLGEAVPVGIAALRQGQKSPVPVTLSTEMRRRHLYILGATGTGKTNLLLQLLHADIEAGRAVCLLDARGDLVDRVLHRLAAGHAPEALQERLLLIDLRGAGGNVQAKDVDAECEAAECVVGFNPLTQSGSDPYTSALFVLDVLRQQLGSTLGVQTEETLRCCLLALAMTGGTLLQIEPLLTCPAFRRDVLRRVEDGSVRRFFDRFDALGAQQLQWTTPVLNKITPWLARPSLRRLLGQPGGASLRDMLDARPDAILLICLGADELFGAAHLVGSLVTSAVASAVMRTDRPEACRHPLFFYLDEFENVSGTGEQFEAILSEGRRFGLGLTLSHQASSQLSPRLRSLIRNVVATQIFFATGGLDADTLAGEIPSEEPKAVLRSLLMSQKIGEALITRRGLPFARMRTAHRPDPDVSVSAVQKLRQASLRVHGCPRQDVDALLAEQERQWEAERVPKAGRSVLQQRGQRATQLPEQEVSQPGAEGGIVSVDDDVTGQGVAARRAHTVRPAYEVREAEVSQPVKSTAVKRKGKTSHDNVSANNIPAKNKHDSTSEGSKPRDAAQAGESKIGKHDKKQSEQDAPASGGA